MQFSNSSKINRLTDVKDKKERRCVKEMLEKHCNNIHKQIRHCFLLLPLQFRCLEKITLLRFAQQCLFQVLFSATLSDTTLPIALFDHGNATQLQHRAAMIFGAALSEAANQKNYLKFFPTNGNKNAKSSAVREFIEETTNFLGKLSFQLTEFEHYSLGCVYEDKGHKAYNLFLKGGLLSNAYFPPEGMMTCLDISLEDVYKKT